MNYYSTRDKKKVHPATLEVAVIRGLAPDGGLYLPEKITPFDAEFVHNIATTPLETLAYAVADTLTGNTIPESVLRTIVRETIDFPMPVVKVEDNIYALELFHGPTMAFKDVGARFMARLMGWFVRNSSDQLNVIVATSGDTGSAVAAGFYGVPGIQVTIIYPSGKVSPLQEKQLTTWGGNIRAIELDGTFDDCQIIAKQLLLDNELKNTHSLTSANSINIARLIPQSFYYFEAYAKLAKHGRPIVVSVPSGNFGNLTGGLLANKLGLPIAHFVAATNANDIVPKYLTTGKYTPKPSVQTISNAMDVGNPSNFERMSKIFGENINEFKASLSAYAYRDEETTNTIRSVFRDSGYLLDPHGAVGYLGLKTKLKEAGFTEHTGVLLETAHPAKFIDVVQNAISHNIPLPSQLQAFAEKEKMAFKCPNRYEAVKEFLFP